MKKFIEIIDRYPVVFVLALTLLILIAINFAARLFLKEPVGHALTQDEVLKRIYGDKSIEEYRTVLQEQSIGQKYYPFVEYIEKARNGKFVTVSEQGTRCHYSDLEKCIAKGGVNEIWIFGGSTTFGYSVKNNETIAAYLSESFPRSKIVNFGTASYYSTIERIRFENLLTELPPPKAAIFIDGLNDFYHYKVPDESNFSASYALIINSEPNFGSFFHDARSYLKKRIKSFSISRLLEEKFGSKATIDEHTNISNEQLLKTIARFNRNHEILESIGGKFGITILNVLQPVPLYGIGHKTSSVPTELLNFKDHVNSGAAYREMLKPNGEIKFKNPHMLNLANLGISESMYVDTVHYTPMFNKKIAQEISQKLIELLKENKQ